MKYCVLKNTTIVINKGIDEGILIENALTTKTNDGESVEYEILTEEEYQTRLELEPIPPKKPTKEELLEQRINDLELYILTQEGLI